MSAAGNVGTAAPIEYADASAEVRAVYDDIMATRKTDWVNNYWKVLAHHPPTLRRMWANSKEVMGPGALDPLTKELIYMAVSVTNGCKYCIASHGAAARTKGMTPLQAELVAIIGLANETNRHAVALDLQIDEQFEWNKFAGEHDAASARHYRWDDMRAEPLKGGITRRLITTERMMIAHVYFKKGDDVPRHAHENEQITYILEGALHFWLGANETREVTVRSGEVLVIPSNLPHRALALEDTLDVDVFNPPRQDWLDGSDAYLRR